MIKKKVIQTTDNEVVTGDLIVGEIVALNVVFDGSSLAGTDTTLEVVSEGADQALLTLTNVNTSAWYYPRIPAQDGVGSDVTFDGTNEIYTNFAVDGNLKLTTAQNTVGLGVKVYVYYK